MKHRGIIALLVVFFAGLICLWWADYAEVPTTDERDRLSERVLPALFRVQPGEVRRIEITSAGEGASSGPLVFERGDAFRWRIIKPIDAEADQSKVEALVRRLIDLQPARGTEKAEIKGPPAQYGLDRPAHTVSLYGANPARPIATLEIGKAQSRQRFVRAAGNDAVKVVDASLIALVDLPLVDWRERLLFELASFQVQHVIIKGKGHELEAQRTGTHWDLLRPIRALADPSAIDGVIADLVGLQVADGAKGYVADNATDLTPYGLDAPQMTIELVPRRTNQAESADSLQPQVVEIGKPVPGVAERAYARRAGHANVVIVNTRPLKDLGSNPRALRSKRLADLELPRVNYIEVAARDVTHVLARGRDGWEVLSPHQGRADLLTLQNFLRRLADAQTSDFLDPGQFPNSGVDEPLFVIKVWQAAPDAPAILSRLTQPEAEPVLDVKIGKLRPEAKIVFAQTAGDPTSLLALQPDVLEVMPTGPLAFRERTILSQNPEDITRVAIVRGGTTYEVRSGAVPSEYSRWKMTRPVTGPADPEVVARLVVLLARVRAETLVTEKPESYGKYGLDSPVLSVSWTLRPPALPRGTKVASVPSTLTEWTLHIGGEVPGKRGSRYAMLAGQPTIFTVTSLAYQYLNSELHDRKVLSFRPDQAARLLIRWPEQTLAYSRTAQPGTAGESAGWAPEPGTPPRLFASDRLDVLTTALSALAATRFRQYSGPFPAEAGLTPPRATIEVQLSGQPTTLELFLGNRAFEGQRFATTARGSEGPVFLLSDAFWAVWATPVPAHPELPEDVFAR